MISFRYHLVSIVSVFLALGLGLLAGTTVVEPGLVKTLRNRTDTLFRTTADLRKQVGDLQAQLGQWQKAGDILPALDKGRLTGVPVMIVTQDGVDGTLLSEARAALDEAGANLIAVLSATGRMASSDASTQQDLARILGVQPTATASSDLPQRAAIELGQRLADGVPRRAGSPPTPDVLGQLLSADFLAVPPGSPSISDATLPDIGGKGQVVVALAGGQAEPTLAPDAFMVPLVNELVRRSATVAAGEGVSTIYPFVGSLRTDGAAQAGDRMVTVDDLDLNLGGAALVLGLERLLATGHGGNYGIKTGASSPIPPV